MDVWFWLLLAGILGSAACKDISNDDIGTTINILVDRIKTLESTVQSQSKVIQTHQETMESLREIIRTQSEAMKVQQKNIAELNDVTRELEFDAKQQKSKVKLLESRIKRQNVFIRAESGQHGTNKAAPDKKPYTADENEMELQETTLFESTEAMSSKSLVEEERASQTEQGVLSTLATRNNNVEYARRLLTPVQVGRVAFTAYLDKTISHVGIDHTIPFNKVLLNEGNAFNTHTGIFLCPQTGVYLFSFTIESDNAGFILVKLVIDGNNQIDVVADGHAGSDQTSSSTAIVHVSSGQSVWIANYYNNDITFFNADAYRYTTFSGVLLF